ncbi:MlaD family protein [Kaistella sp. PBT33-4]|uniref:MlaD family protein n=1 Tax=Kaistella sp. PBT33-4 TaxID=3032000 RepID=UPI0023D800DC|nr:MlaD family protein [Kaistella sp. PBT33-4]MDF0719331.1 MlaD family protein [Kaistella sp. PBT33-4]
MKLSKEIKAGLIAVLSIVGFVLIFQFMKGKSLFTTDNIFYAKYDNVEGIEPASKVSINGLKVGQVNNIIPVTDKNGRVYFVISFAVDNDFKFSKESVVEVFEPGIMSAKEMRINLAYKGAIAKDGDTLVGNYKPSLINNLGEQVGPVKDQLQEVLKKVDSLAYSANQVLDDRNRAEIRALLISLNRTVAAFETTSRQANALVANNDPKLQRVLDNANATMITANTAVDKYGRLAESIDTQKLNATVANLDATVSKLNNVISGIDRGEGSLGKVMKDEELYNNLNSASNNLNALIEDLKANPKRYLNFSVFGKNTKD